MECRICHQTINFVRAQHPGHKRQATLAVHNADVSRILEQTQGKVVEPHPGMQRRLRQALEAQHDSNRIPAEEHAMTASTTEPDEPEKVNEDNLAEESFAASGRQSFAEELEQYNSVSPELTAGDVDADWHRAESSGEETPGGHMATPDQDNVDEIGRALGMELQDNQELRTHEELLAKRDRDRWELNRSSTEGDSI